MKNTKKLISILLVAMLLITTVVVSSVSVSATGTLASYYQTNPSNQFGTQKTITIDGDASDWSDSDAIAYSAAWDCPNHWKGSHENNLSDCYALFGAYDSTNLYIGVQYVNTTDTWQRPGDASLSDSGKMRDIPLMIALDVSSSNNAMTGQVVDENGKTGSIWGFNTTFDTFFEFKIPLSTLGIDASYVAGNGVGVIAFGTRGESLMDSVPFDPTVLDNVMGDYSKDPSTSLE